MKIDINKKYRYRMGDPVRILCVDAVGPKFRGKPQPVVALDSKTGETTFHFEDGRFDSIEKNDALDLIEVREPRQWEITFYQDGSMRANMGGLASPRGETIRVREILD